MPVPVYRSTGTGPGPGTGPGTGRYRCRSGTGMWPELPYRHHRYPTGRRYGQLQKYRARHSRLSDFSHASHREIVVPRPRCASVASDSSVWATRSIMRRPCEMSARGRGQISPRYKFFHSPLLGTAARLAQAHQPIKLAAKRASSTPIDRQVAAPHRPEAPMQRRQVALVRVRPLVAAKELGARPVGAGAAAGRARAAVCHALRGFRA